jgi:hypothetical protein
MEPHYRLDERLPAMGLAFLLDAFDGHLIAGHDGGWPGFLSSMLLCPEEDLGVVVFVNASSLAAQEAAQGLMEAMLDVPEPASRLPKKGILGSPTSGRSYAASAGRWDRSTPTRGPGSCTPVNWRSASRTTTSRCARS